MWCILKFEILWVFIIQWYDTHGLNHFDLCCDWWTGSSFIFRYSKNMGNTCRYTSSGLAYYGEKVNLPRVRTLVKPSEKHNECSFFHFDSVLP